MTGSHWCWSVIVWEWEGRGEIVQKLFRNDRVGVAVGVGRNCGVNKRVPLRSAPLMTFLWIVGTPMIDVPFHKTAGLDRSIASTRPQTRKRQWPLLL